MRSITFTKTVKVNDGAGTGRVFEAGETYELPPASCERWVRRGVAGYVGKDPGVPEVTASFDLGPVVIPDNWQDLDWSDLRALAKQIDPDVRTKDDAIAAVELEIERRKQG